MTDRYYVKGRNAKAWHADPECQRIKARKPRLSKETARGRIDFPVLPATDIIIECRGLEPCHFCAS